MKMVGYAIFGVAILMASVFLLAPEGKDQKKVAPSKTTRTIPTQEPKSTDTSTKTTPSGEETAEAVGTNLADVNQPSLKAGSDVSKSQRTENKSAPGTANQAQEDYISKPGDLTFDASQVPDFPPLPPLADEESSQFDELPAQGFPQENFGDGFGSNEDFPLESGAGGELGNNEF